MGPDFVGHLAHSINLAQTNAEAAAAQTEDTKDGHAVVALCVAVYNRTIKSALDLIVSKNVNVNMNIKSQEDVGNFTELVQSLPPEVQAAYAAVLDHETQRILQNEVLALPEARRVE